MDKKRRLRIQIVAILFLGLAGIFLESCKQVRDTETVAGTGESREESPEGSRSSLTELDFNHTVVSISTGQNKGNGVILYKNEDLHVICTARHVVEHLEESQILVDEQEVDVETLWLSPNFDVAFLEVSGLTDHLQTTGLSEDGFSNLTAGDMLVIQSLYEGEEIKVDIQVKNPWIMVEDFGYHMIWASSDTAKGGMSGSGVFDREGYLAGILCGGNETEVVVLPVNIILGELKNSGIDISFE